MAESLNDFSSQYQKMLKNYLQHGGEEHLHGAYELGRKALASGLGLLDITYAHQAAMPVLLQGKEDDRFLLLVRAANRFLDETLSPFEVSRLSSMDANTALRRLYDVLEDEAKRIAHVLHDESAQILATVYLELADIVRNAPGPLAGRINEVVKLLDEVRDQLRRLSHELRPLILDQLGLVPALSFLANGVNKRSGLEVEVSGETGGRLPQAVETVLYRTVQEALNNVNKHAQATRADVKVWVEHEMIHCVVRDNGVGFEVPEDRKKMYRGLGLVGIHERVGALHGECRLNSAPGEGTELQVVIPL